MEAAALTGAQRAGLACVLCGADLAGAPIPSRPVGKVSEGQVFACTTHDEEPGEEPSGDMRVPGWYAPPVPVRQDDGMDVVEFLRARLAEDEQVTYNPAFMPVTGPGLSDLVKRGLAEIEAKRKLLSSHYDYRGVCTRCFDWQNKSVEREQFPCEVVRLLALPYADHPDYREEWRP